MFEHSFLGNPCAYLADMFRTLLFGFEYSNDETYLRERQRVNEFTHDNELDADTSILLCDIAQQKMRDKFDCLKTLDAKRDSFIKFASGMIVFLAAASKAFSFPLVAFKLSLVCFLISTVVLLLSRRVIEVPSIAPIQSLREGIGKAANARDWLAASLHKSCEGYTVIETVVASHINFALFWMIVGLTLVTLVAIGFGPAEITSS